MHCTTKLSKTYFVLTWFILFQSPISNVYLPCVSVFLCTGGPYPYTLKLCFSTAQHANWVPVSSLTHHFTSLLLYCPLWLICAIGCVELTLCWLSRSTNWVWNWLNSLFLMEEESLNAFVPVFWFCYRFLFFFYCLPWSTVSSVLSNSILEMSPCKDCIFFFWLKIKSDNGYLCWLLLQGNNCDSCFKMFCSSSTLIFFFQKAAWMLLPSVYLRSGQ